MQRLKIAIFQDTYHPTMNGVVVSTDLFVRGLRARGHEVMLVVPRYPNDDVEHDKNAVYIPAIKTDFIYPESCLGKFWKRKTVLEALQEFAPDIIHSMTEFTIGHWMSSYYQKKLGCKRVHTFHTLWTEYLFYVPVPQFISQRWLRWAAEGAVRKRADAVIAPTSKFREILIDDWGIKSVPVDVVPTGIDLAKFKTTVGERFRDLHGIEEDEKVILYLGRMGDEKNVELVIESMAELRKRNVDKLRFVIAGGGPEGYMKKLKKLANSLKLDDIIWTGFITGQNWLDCYGAANITFFPSITETQGLVVIESLAAGVPLVSVRAIGPASTMAGEKGCLWAEATPQDFADKTIRMLNDDVLYERKKQEALEVASAYSMEQRAEELEGVYYRTLGLAEKDDDESQSVDENSEHFMNNRTDDQKTEASNTSKIILPNTKVAV
ncbi:MAG: glycosyltransferase family 4 protein [Deltaproteobacteria bacterium]|nr:glycosyltransferase family 4 protein [Deltaproteobacteria bacterium]